VLATVIVADQASRVNKIKNKTQVKNEKAFE
jgi:hypothetical protein